MQQPIAAERSRDLTSRKGAWPALWIGLALVALAALTEWQRNPGWITLGIAAIVSALALSVPGRDPRTRSVPALAVGALAITIALGVNETLLLRRVTDNWSVWSERERSARADRIVSGILDLATQLSALASKTHDDALRAASASTRFVPPSLASPSTGRVESALGLFKDEHLVAFAGQSRVPLTVGGNGVELVQTPFHVALVARVTSGDGKLIAVATALLASAPPADRFGRSLLQDLAGVSGASLVEIGPPIGPHTVGDSSVRLVVRAASALAQVTALPRLEGEARLTALQRARVRTGIPLFLAALLVLVTAWRRPARTPQRLIVAAALLLVIARAPLGELSNVSSLFDVTNYFARMGGPLTANVAALLLTTSLLLASLFLVLRARRRMPARRLAIAIVVVLAALGPFVLRDLARGIELPPPGASTKLWIAWQLAIALAGASVLLAGATAGQIALGARRGLAGWIAPSIAAAAALFGPALWRAPGAWPDWYPLLWVLAIASLAFTRRSAALVVGAAIVAGSGAVVLTWGSTMRTRMQLAETDLARLTKNDENAWRLLERFALDVATDTDASQHVDALIRRYAASDLGRAGYAARMARWTAASPNIADVVVPLAAIEDSINAQARLADIARESGQVEIRSIPDGVINIFVAAVPTLNGTVTTIAVPPRTRLLPLDPFASYTGLASSRGRAPPYSLELRPLNSAGEVPPANADRLTWHRRERAMHGDAIVGTNQSARQMHVEIELRESDALVPRGALLIMLDVGVVLLMWGASAMADGGLWRWLRSRRKRLTRSYRVRLSLALLAFFVAPAAAFAGWAAIRLPEDDRLARELKLREALRMAEAPSTTHGLSLAASDASSPLYLYREGQLITASDSMLDMLAPIGRLLPTGLDFGETDGGDDDNFEAVRVPVGVQSALVGYRTVRAAPDSAVSSLATAVVATPARGDDVTLDQRRADLGMLVLFAISFGALAALWSSGVAARSLARPVGALREAALALAAGQRGLHLDEAPAAEFSPVFRAFGQMADDLSASRAALESAQRRTEAVLQNVASGVLAVRPDGSVMLANPRADTMLGARLRDVTGDSLESLAPEFAVLDKHMRDFLQGAEHEEAFDVAVQGRQLSARLTRLPGGAVLTLDDVTDLASAQRVLAWGEMARQVAHEIKNPLTPIRLGVQHLRRAYRDGRSDYNEILETNVARVLAEIDRLDEIARAFSRYGTAPAEQPPSVSVDIGAVVRDVLALEQLGEGDVVWSLEWPFDETPVLAWARNDELSEVLLNVLENARLAGAKNVCVSVAADAARVHLRIRDDGSGIAAAVLPRVFEPHFSTRTSGSGLGLAISRRLIEGWGGTVLLESDEGRGTTAHITLRTAPSVT